MLGRVVLLAAFVACVAHLPACSAEAVSTASPPNPHVATDDGAADPSTASPSARPEAPSDGAAVAPGAANGSRETLAFQGTLNGTPFAARSGFFFVDTDGTVALVLSDKPAICASSVQAKLHPNETLVQAYGLRGAAPGRFTSEFNDVKYARVRPTCAAGQPVGDDQIAAASRARTSTIAIATWTASALAGTLDVRFADGSSVNGRFELGACAMPPPESSTCF